MAIRYFMADCRVEGTDLWDEGAEYRSVIESRPDRSRQVEAGVLSKHDSGRYNTRDTRVQSSASIGLRLVAPRGERVLAVSATVFAIEMACLNPQTT